MTIAYLGLGANLGDARQTLKDAVVCLAQQHTISVLAKSSVYRTAPIDSSAYDYFNCVVKLETSPRPRDQLLRLCHHIELQFGRERPYRNAPRTLDLDILLYGASSIDEAGSRGTASAHDRARVRARAARRAGAGSHSSCNAAARMRSSTRSADQRIEKAGRPASAWSPRKPSAADANRQSFHQEQTADERNATHRDRAAIAAAASLHRDRRADRRRQDDACDAARRTLVDAHALRAPAGQSVSRTLLSRHRRGTRSPRS